MTLPDCAMGADLERAHRYLARASSSYVAGFDHQHVQLAKQFAAVRAEERAAIVAWLRDFTGEEVTMHGNMYRSLADRLDRGGHTAPAPKRAGRGE